MDWGKLNAQYLLTVHRHRSRNSGVSLSDPDTPLGDRVTGRPSPPTALDARLPPSSPDMIAASGQTLIDYYGVRDAAALLEASASWR
jgi:hypothetical protein